MQILFRIKDRIGEVYDVIHIYESGDFLCVDRANSFSVLDYRVCKLIKEENNNKEKA